MKDTKENFTKEEAQLEDGRYIIYYNFETSTDTIDTQQGSDSGAGKES